MGSEEGVEGCEVVGRGSRGLRAGFRGLRWDCAQRGVMELGWLTVSVFIDMV